MKDLLRLLIVGLIGYGLYTYFVERVVDAPSEESAEYDSPSRCLGRLDDALDELSSAIRDFAAPPIDTEAWADRHERLEQRVDLAAAACRCPDDACKRGLEAAEPLSLLISDLNDTFSGGGRPPQNAAGRIDEVQRIYEDAKALAR